MFTIKLILAAFANIGLVSCFALPFEGLYPLDIIHYNDFHARFEETSISSPTCRHGNQTCLGGFARLYKEINLLLEEKPDAILLNAGDSFQGTFWYTLLKWNITQEFMNMLPHDAHALGNHEFDDGPAGLAPYLLRLKAPVLAANMDVSGEPSLDGLFRNHIIIKRRGRKIGIFGLITPDTKMISTPGNVNFLEPGVVAKREAQTLVDKGVDIVILLSHCGLNVDKEIASKHGENIDVIIGGHTHSLLWNGVAPSHEEVAGPYPVFVESKRKEGHQVLIVQASAFTKYMGNLTVYFDFRGDYVKWDGGPIFLDQSIPEDPEILAKLKPYADKVHAMEDIPLGETKTLLNYEDCVYGECVLGNAVCDALNEWAKSKVNSSYPYLSFIQRGNLKSSLEGTITKGELFDLLPYNDRVLTFELQGKYVVEALQRSLSNAWAYDPFKGPYVLQLSGLKVTYNIIDKTPSISSIEVFEDNVAKPFNELDYYQVTMPTYLGDGGDGFTMFSEGRRNVQEIGRDQVMFETYIKKHSPLNVIVDGRIVITQ